jgi:type I restriction enzyme R subunit
MSAPTPSPNQTLEQIARDNIDRQLISCGWIIQNKNKINLNAGPGVAIRKYYTDSGPADYVLFVDQKPVGIIEAKKEKEGVRLTTFEDQSMDYAVSTLKYLKNDPLLYVF